MDNFLQDLAALSLGGGGVALALMVTARFTRSRYAARWRCWVWLLLCARLAFPFSLAPAISQPQAPIQLPAVEDRVLLQPGQPPVASGAQTDSPLHTPPAQSGQPVPVQEPEGASISLSQALLLLWLLGAAGVLGWSLLSHLRFLRYLRRWAAPVSTPEVLMCYNALGDQLNLHRRPSLLTCPGLSVPMLAGLLHPVLLLPEAVPAGDELKYSLLHELTHYRRRDIWRKTLALWVRAVHWFNPLVWLAARWMDRDIELSCDEGALKLLPPEEHAAYGRTILNAASAPVRPLGSP